MELFKRIDDTEYFVSNKGNVVRNGKVLKPVYNSKGYPMVNIHNKGTRKSRVIHRLVAENFIKNPNNLPTVNHIDEDKKNNNVKNLEWVSYRKNNTHGTRIKRAVETNIKNGKKAHKIIGISLTSGLILEFNSIKEASRNVFVEPCIYRVIRGIHSQHKGFRFMRL